LARKRAGRKHDASNTHAIPNSSAGSSVDINPDDTGKFNAALLATTALAATDPDALSRLLPTLSSWFAPNGTTTTIAATSSLDASFLLPPRGPPTDTFLKSTISANASQPPLGLLSPESHELDNSRASLMPFLTAGRPDADINLNDVPDADRDHSGTFDFGSSSSDGISSSFILSPGALLKDNLCGLSNSIDIAPSSRPPAHKPC
jgi:hypothetical protein